MMLTYLITFPVSYTCVLCMFAGSLSPHHDNISDDSGLDVDRHYHTWSSDEGRHANRPSILPKVCMMLYIK